MSDPCDLLQLFQLCRRRYAAALLFVRFFGEESDKDFLPENAREEKICKIREVLAQFEKDGCIL